MQPSYQPGSIVVVKRFKHLPVKESVVIIKHNQIDKLKRITDIRPKQIYVEGDNPVHSVDSRQFGWIDQNLIQGTVIWPRKRRSKL